MKISLDRVADAGYVKISNKKIAKTIDASEYCNIDLSEDGYIVGIELLFISQYASDFKLWLNMAGAAEYLNKAQITVRRWAKEGKIPHYKMGKEYAFSLNELNEYVQKHKKISESQIDYNAVVKRLDRISKKIESAEKKIEAITEKVKSAVTAYNVGDSELRISASEEVVPAGVTSAIMLEEQPYQSGWCGFGNNAADDVLWYSPDIESKMKKCAMKH